MKFCFAILLFHGSHLRRRACFILASSSFWKFLVGPFQRACQDVHLAENDSIILSFYENPSYCHALDQSKGQKLYHTTYRHSHICYSLSSTCKYVVDQKKFRVNKKFIKKMLVKIILVKKALSDVPLFSADRQTGWRFKARYGNPFIKQWSGIFYILSEISQNIL